MGVVTAQKSRLSSPLTGKAVDYSQPVQTVTREARPAITNAPVVNDWREFIWSMDCPEDFVRGSSTFSAYAVDNYGTNFDVWVSVYASDGGSTVLSSDVLIFNYGWSDVTPNNYSFPMTTALGRKVKVVFRFRYSDSASNPPSSNVYTALRFWITWQEPVNYTEPQTTALPPDWTVSTTQTTETTPVVTTTQYYDLSEFTDTGNTIRYYMSTIFGIADSGADITRIMNYIDAKTKYSSAIAAFCLLCGVIVYAMKWE